MPISLPRTDRFADRHIGPSEAEIQDMLDLLGVDSLDALAEEAIPADIRVQQPLDLPAPKSEYELLAHLHGIAAKNQVFRSYLGLGYHGTVTPPAIQRNILENPNWYTQYTPYQAEIAQGRLEMLLNYQTVVSDLTGLPIANASLLDEGTAAAEAMMMLKRQDRRGQKPKFFVAADCHPQTIEVVATRAVPLGVEIVVGDPATFVFSEEYFGALLQYPTTDGAIHDYRAFCDAAHAAGAAVVAAADLLSLTLLTPPGEWGADVAVGNTQRFGVPLGFGGPHAAYFATKEDFKRQVPGRLIGLTQDADGNPALRMALQTREQHIRRDKATSNICTAQVLLANIAGAYAVYHGPEGLKKIATRVHGLTRILAEGLQRGSHTLRHTDFFDTLRVDPAPGQPTDMIRNKALAAEINLRYYEDGSVGLALDETVTAADLADLFAVFDCDVSATELAEELDEGYTGARARTSGYLDHPTFHRYQSETELMRYLHRLSSRDLSLTTSMIPLGSCTMKLNAATELMPITWPAFNQLHPFVPKDQTAGYQQIIRDLETWLAEITGFAATSLQPNSGASGEYAGLLAIRAYHAHRGDTHRDICLIPSSAHGTNPASAVMAGMTVVVVKCDENGNIDVDDLRAKADQHADNLAALMVTYPSTHGVFETSIREICAIIHERGGQVYIDGANMNAQVGLARPGDYGGDVCHLNLHKTFAIPHGGGGPGMGPICVAEHLAPFLMGHPLVETGGAHASGPVAAAPYGSASILLISWAYIALLGEEGMRRSSQVAILNANYMAKRLDGHFDVLFRGRNGRVAHEFILDLRPYKQGVGISEVDVAKRLMDYGYHAPTMSWPVVGTMMVEPTESESKAELDRFVAAMIAIRSEIQEVELGGADAEHNVLKNAPHTAAMVLADDWSQPYTREQAAFPAPWTREHKFWPTVRRVNDAYGDRNLVCTCPPMEAYAE